MTRRLAIVLFALWSAAAYGAQEQGARPPWFGFAFSYHPPNLAAGSQNGWLTVQEVDPGGPASDAGLQERDMIVAIASQPLRFENDFEVLKLLATLKPGVPVVLSLRRGDARRTTKIIPKRSTEEQAANFKKVLDDAGKDAARSRPGPH